MSTFDLDFINADSKNNLFFLPFGVTSIGFISNGANASSGNILPICNDLGGKKSKYVGYVDGTASEKPEFLVIWGGGNKRGQFVRLGSRERIFLQLIHLGSDTKKTQITFKNEHGWRKILTLIPAETNTSVVRMKIEECKEKRTMTFVGDTLPNYYCRWWPPIPSKNERIEYCKLDFPKVVIEYSMDDSGIIKPKNPESSQVEISILKGAKKKKICGVNGDLNYAVPHAELFFLLPHFFVLRLWFYWIHTRFESDNFRDIRHDETDSEDQRLIRQKITQEIPDIERFDLVIDEKAEKVIYCGTDIHYQEYWSKTTDEIVDARIGRDIEVVVEPLKLLKYRFVHDFEHNPVKDLIQVIKNEHPEIVFEKTAIEAAVEEREEVRGLYLRSHVPFIKNSQTSEELVSSVISKL